MEIDLSEDSRNNIMAEYGPLLCDGCRLTLELRAVPIVERLNRGCQPKVRDVLKLLNALCPSCQGRIVSKMRGGF